MEPPSKRSKLGQAPYDNDDDDDDDGNIDELSMSPTQFNARQDPLYQLDKKRAKAATRLKSAFERIFEKYERDFTGIGDEIDLETGEVIVDNGHLLSLEDEKDRNREGSVLSDEEGAAKVAEVAKGKEDQLVEGFGHQSLSTTIPPTMPPLHGPIHGPIHSPSPDPYAGLSQPPMPGGFNYPLPYPGMQLHSFGLSDPFMFGPPMIGSSSVDPLWQTPELPLPTFYQDRFGFMGQPMGYHHPLGYGPSMVPGGSGGPGSYHNAFLGPPFQQQVPKNFPHAKTTKQKVLPRPTPATNDSEEDDILSGNTTQDTTEITTIERSKSSPLTSVIKKLKRTDQKETEVHSVNATEKGSHIHQKPHRRRPRKAAVSAEQSYSPKEIISPPPLLEEDFAIIGQAAERLSRIEILIRARGPADVFEKSTRSREPKSHQSPTTVNPSNPPEDVVLETSDSSAPKVDEYIDHAESEATQHVEVTQPIVGEELKELNDKEPVNQAGIPTPNEESHGDELPVDHEDINDQEIMITGNMIYEAEIGNLHSSIDNSGETDFLFSNHEASTLATGIPTVSKTPPDSEPASPSSLLNEPKLLDSLPDLDQTDRGINLEDGGLKDAKCVDPALYDLMHSEIQDASQEVLEINPARGNSHELTPIPPATIKPEETINQLPDPVQELGAMPPSASPTMELEPLLEHATAQPDIVEQGPDLPDSLKEGEVEPPVAQEPEIPPLPQLSPSAETSQLVLRPVAIQSEQGNEVEPIDLPNPPKKRPSPAKKATSKTLAPSTPKKRSRMSATVQSPNSTHRTPSSRKRFALTSLIPNDPTQDDDELSILSSSVPTSPFFIPEHDRTMTSRHHHRHHKHSNSSSPRKPDRRHGFLIGSNNTTTITTTPHHRTSKHPTLPPATDSRAFRGTKRTFAVASSPVAQSSPLARTVVNVDSVGFLASSPSRRAKKIGGGGGSRAMSPSVVMRSSGSSPVRGTSGGGGETRRCGEDGFVCDRDFCFTCCK
ncbi:uncharacterized protein F4812DRAFT_124901 [Daldinia caldariorum]|uniref:uncharacterized protein n=1 Tax=Daldinia caldariorum TaxID=326644 RepID=UPI002008AA39|nr:uncharacterized protein F4812DRAFT_124901 [Daldinia caldariorum]KAI1465480.1 hypothetical protein F4812DRAFT_124901 [Daldinia caldariorum]